ncbi:hypothetical protein ACIQAC_11740 [Streptomyces sp. NPDC088387]|uniref:terpene synthase family protein n=1 Tax=Streptomyces sp. NPDC088387 TaxID=3365859 RepID=UPI00381AB62B
MTDTVPVTRIPRLYCPIPFAVHPDAEEINKAGLKWLSGFRLYNCEKQWKRYVSAKPGMLPAHVMPRAPRGPALQAAANLLFWLWAFDDLECDEAGDDLSAGNLTLLLCDLARVVEAPSGRSAANPILATLADLRRQLEEVATPVQVARWASAMQAYFLANTGVAIQNQRHLVPDLDTYVTLRIHSGAVKPTLMLLDVADGYELPPAELERPEIWALNEMVCAIVGWDNDVLTYHKEVIRGGADHNLVTVLSRENNCSPAEAVAQAVEMRDRALDLFLRLREQVAADAGPDLLRYLTGLSSWIRGHLDWGMATARYRNPENPAHLPRSLAAEPSVHDQRPLPVPSIAWWWRQLRPVEAMAPPLVTRLPRTPLTPVATLSDVARPSRPAASQMQR